MGSVKLIKLKTIKESQKLLLHKLNKKCENIVAFGPLTIFIVNS